MTSYVVSIGDMVKKRGIYEVQTFGLMEVCGFGEWREKEEE